MTKKKKKKKKKKNRKKKLGIILTKSCYTATLGHYCFGSITQPINNSLFRLLSEKINVSLTYLLKQSENRKDFVGFKTIFIIPIYMFFFHMFEFPTFELFCRLQFHQ